MFFLCVFRQPLWILIACQSLRDDEIWSKLFIPTFPLSQAQLSQTVINNF